MVDLGQAWLRRVISALVNGAGKRPVFVLLSALLVMVASWSYASRLELRSDVLELLPRDSPGLQAFEARARRAGGRATILVVAESPDRSANERFIDDLYGKLEGLKDGRAMCAKSCGASEACIEGCGPELIAFIESSTKELRSFFQTNRWLYATEADLEEADATLDREIAVRSGAVEDLLGDDAAATEKKGALGLEAYSKKWQQAVADRDQFPSGYFASNDGSRVVMRIVSTSAGMGASSDDTLLHHVRQFTRELRPESYHPKLTIGLGGDIPNAEAEREALVREAIVATLLAAVLILGGVVWFYRSLWALIIVGLPPLIGVGCAYAFATAKYGFVNASGAFLGAIILGNGVNYPIVLYSRYKEFRARGIPKAEARLEAVLNAFRAELVGALVAAIAYGSLTVTRFRGFSQFGVIGFVGMLLVWITMIPTVPALIVILERIEPKLPSWLREKPAVLAEDESRGPIARWVGNVTERYAGFFVVAGVIVTVFLALRLPSFLRDPWEYDFEKLGARSSYSSGAAQWSAKAYEVLNGRLNLAGSIVLSDRPDQTAEVKARILENDAADPNGSLIESITTLDDFLPGAPEVQRRKLDILSRMRDRLTPTVLATLSESERKQVEEMTPPETLRVVDARDLPSLLVRRFSERSGTIGTILFIAYKPFVSTNDGHYLLRMAGALEGLRLADGTRIDAVSRATVFAEMIRSLRRDGPLATAVSFGMVVLVVLFATFSLRGAISVLGALVAGVVWMMGIAVGYGERLNFLNFIALPITFGIGSEYPFNIFDRSRLLGGNVTRAVKLHFGAVALCSYTTTIGYGSLLFADNQALQSFGRLAIGGEIACLLAAVLLLPSLLHLLARWRPARSSAVLEAGAATLEGSSHRAQSTDPSAIIGAPRGRTSPSGPFKGSSDPRGTGPTGSDGVV